MSRKIRPLIFTSLCFGFLICFGFTLGCGGNEEKENNTNFTEVAAINKGDQILSNCVTKQKGRCRTECEEGEFALSPLSSPDNYKNDPNSCIAIDEVKPITNKLVCCVKKDEPIDSCSELNTTECFSNLDCPDNKRCQNMGTANLALPCCVPGVRGKKQGGEQCSELGGQLECASGICIAIQRGQFQCSKTCENSNDCPIDMQQCYPINAPPNKFKWCFPEM